jgi:DNA-binding beta-propeller fold protein YncE
MPKGVASDSEGTIYVVDTLFDNVQLFDEKGEFLLTLGSRGIGQGEFWMPSGIFIDGGDKLYVCDTYNQRIQIFEIMRDGR